MVNYNDIKSVKEYMESKGIRFTGGNVEIGNAQGWAIMGGKSSLRILQNARDGVKKGYYSLVDYLVVGFCPNCRLPVDL